MGFLSVFYFFFRFSRMAKAQQTKSKDAKAKAAMSSSKGKKKKWSKTKTREKVNNLVVFDQATYDRFVKEVPSYKLITPSVVSDRLKINASLARRALRQLEEQGLIKLVASGCSQLIYTRATAATA